MQDDLPVDIYPIHVVRDGNIVGSCSTYDARKDITAIIHDGSDSVHQIVEKYEKSF